MSVMTAQPPLPIATEPATTPLGDAAALIEDADGGRVFLHGNLVYAWAPGEDALRRWSAVQLARLGAAPVAQIATAFGVDPGTVWRWGQTLTSDGVSALASDKRGPKGPHRLTAPVVARIQALHADGKSPRAIAEQVGVSQTSVRRVLIPDAAPPTAGPDQASPDADGSESADAAGPDQVSPDADGSESADAAGPDQVSPEADGSESADAASSDAGLDDDEPGRAGPAVPALPVLPPAVDRSGERAAARFGLIEHAAPVFAPAARVPLAGLMLALPGLEATGLLSCARNVFGALPNGFYGLDTVLLEAVLRTLAGEARAEGATRIDPAAFGRVLGLDRAPEVKTIRRKRGLLAGTGQVGRLVAAMAATHLARPDAPGSDPGDAVGMVLYVDGHVRTYHGTRKIGKTHVARLRFPAPATVETWVGDAHGDPVLVVMAEPGASLAGELRRLVPDLRAAVGDDRRVLVGFDRGGWSPALFKHLHGHGFDVLTWRKGATPDIPTGQFTDLTFLDPDTGREHQWRAADTTVTLTLTLPKTKPKPKPKTASGGADHEETDTPDDDQAGTDGDTEDIGTVFTMRQVTLAVPATKHTKKRAAVGDHGEAGDGGGGDGDGGDAGGGGGPRQIHILTTRTDLPAEQIIHRMGSRWRQENGFRYGRMRFELDSHDSYAATDDNPDRLVPNPAKKRAYQQVVTAGARLEQAAADTDTALLAARTPAPGVPALLTNEAHDAITAGLHAAEAALDTAEVAHAAIPTRLPLGQVNPGQQVLDTQVKLLTHAIRIAAFNTDATLARQLRLHTGYSRKKHEAHTLIRQALTASGDIDPSVDGVLTIRLDPLPTRRASTAIAELCEHLTATKTRYPGTDLIMRYEIKTAS